MYTISNTETSKNLLFKDLVFISLQKKNRCKTQMWGPLKEKFGFYLIQHDSLFIFREKEKS